MAPPTDWKPLGDYDEIRYLVGRIVDYWPPDDAKISGFFNEKREKGEDKGKKCFRFHWGTDVNWAGIISARSWRRYGDRIRFVPNQAWERVVGKVSRSARDLGACR